MKMADKVFISKGVVVIFQVTLIILLITTAIHFEDVKQAKDYLDLAKNNPDFQITEELDKVYIRYRILLSVVILSTIKVPLISAGIILNHILILFGSILIDRPEIIARIIIIIQQVFIMTLLVVFNSRMNHKKHGFSASLFRDKM